MAEVGLDLAFHAPQPLKQVMADHEPDILITMDEDPACASLAASHRIAWHLPDAGGMQTDQIRILRDTIENKVKTLLHRDGHIHFE